MSDEQAPDAKRSVQRRARPAKWRVPTSFKIGGHRIKVRWHKALVERQDAFGLSHLSENRIELQEVKRGIASHEHQEQTFCHELVHFILHLIGETELNNNEQFVDRFGQSLYQALSTMRYS